MKSFLRFFGRHYVDEWKFMFRSPTLLLILLFVPVFYPMVISLLYEANRPIKRPVVLMDLDNSEYSRALSFRLESTQALEIVKRTGQLGDGIEELKTGRAEVLIYIPSGFSTLIHRKEQAHLPVWINSENMLAYGASVEAINEVLLDYSHDLGRRFFHQQGMTTALADMHILPIKLSTNILFTPEMGYGNFLITGIFLIILQQIVILALAVTVGLRRQKGMPVFERPYPVTWMVASALAQITFYAGAICFMTFCVFPLFGWTIRSTIELLLLFTVFMFAVIPLSMFAAAFIRSSQSPFQVLVFFSTPVFMISGFTWPLDQMPSYIQALAMLFPTTPALHAIRLLSSKTADLAYIAPYLLETAGLGVFYFVLAWLNIHFWAGKETVEGTFSASNRGQKPVKKDGRL